MGRFDEGSSLVFCRSSRWFPQSLFRVLSFLVSFARQREVLWGKNIGGREAKEVGEEGKITHPVARQASSRRRRRETRMVCSCLSSSSSCLSSSDKNSTSTKQSAVVEDVEAAASRVPPPPAPPPTHREIQREPNKPLTGRFCQSRAFFKSSRAHSESGRVPALSAILPLGKKRSRREEKKVSLFAR